MFKEAGSYLQTTKPRSPATFPEAGRRSPSGAASPTLGYRSYSPSFSRTLSPPRPRPETASRPTGGTASRLGQAVLALANIDADELEIRNLSSIQSNDSRMDKREQEYNNGGPESGGYMQDLGYHHLSVGRAGASEYANSQIGRFLIQENRRISRHAANNNPTDTYNTDQGTWTTAQTSQLTNHRKPIDLQDMESVYMEAGASPLLRGGGRRYHAVPTAEEGTAHLSTEQQKKEMNKRKRVVMKGGLTNVSYKNISKKRRRYISDLFTTLLDSSWLWMVMMFSASFYVTWLFFAILYYITCYFHGDLLPEHLPNLQEESGWTPCILMIDSFAACFLFSLETQHTIGYGSRQTTTECPETMVIASIQSVIGCLVQAFMVGLVFSKLSRPGSRSKTVIFSQNAVVTLRNRRLCLIFRIGDLRDDNFILGTQISAKLVRRRITQEGELYEEMQALKVEPDSTGEACIFFVWPLEVVHIIDEDSPFFDMSATELAKEKFEIAVVMEGCIETTSMNFQARTSYLPAEILWGHRFEPMMLYRKDNNKFQVNFSAFHSTYEVETPTCSARDLEIYQTKEQQQKAVRNKFSMVSRGSGFPCIPGSTSGDVVSLQDYPHNSAGYESSHLAPDFIPRSSSSSMIRVNNGRKTTQANLAPAAQPAPTNTGTRDDTDTSTDSTVEKTAKETSDEKQ